MDIPTRTITSFHDLTEIGTTLGKNWYRGHSKIYNNLIPRIFRKSGFISDFLQDREMELNTIENFKRYAPSINIKLPPQEDTLQWMFLMQHHDFPTRLLDWSESILIATFFAVTENKNDDGEIITIFPLELNKKSGFNGLPLPNNKILKFLSNQPLHNNHNELAKELNLETVPLFPLAFLPPLSLPRMSAQLSAFTIHPSPPNKYGIEKILTDKKYICKYIIPSKLKSKIELNLAYLGISYRTIFPDLVGLSKSFQREQRYYGWGQPNPPLFD